MKKILCSLLAAATILTTGCATEQPRTYAGEVQVDVVGELNAARQPLFDNLVVPLSKDQPIIAASFANIDDLSHSSTFGRMASEILAAGMTNRGYQVIDVRAEIGDHGVYLGHFRYIRQYLVCQYPDVEGFLYEFQVQLQVSQRFLKGAQRVLKPFT